MTEFKASDSKGARKRTELGPFNKESYAPPDKVRIFKSKHTCIDGKKYEGEWSENGMRDGFGI